MFQGFNESTIKYFQAIRQEETFFSRNLLDSMVAAYDSVIDIYQLMKEAL